MHSGQIYGVRRYKDFVQIISQNVIIDDQQTISDSLNATANTKFQYPQIYIWIFVDFLKTSLTWSVFELETCSFFQMGQNFGGN